MRKNMTNINNILIALILSLLSVGTVSAQNIKFTYDDAGNRIKRETIQIEQVNNIQDKTFKKIITPRRIDKDISVNADKYTDKIRIGINDNNFNGPLQVEIYSIAGYKMIGTTTSGKITDIDISRLPRGTYVVLIKYKDKSNVYKINYIK